MANANVSDHLRGILNSGSPLMQQARTQGMQSANSRGLLNSSIATGAAQSAVTQAALPIASQQAGQAFEANQQRRAFQQERKLQRQGYKHENRLQERQLGSAADLQAAQIASTEGIARQNIAASLQEKAGAAVQAAQAVYSQTFGSIMNNPEIPESVRENYIAHAGRVLADNLALIEQTYGISLDWETPTLPAADGGGGKKDQTGGGGSGGGGARNNPRTNPETAWQYQ